MIIDFIPQEEMLDKIVESLGSLTTTSSKSRSYADGKLRRILESEENYTNYLSLIMCSKDLRDEIRVHASIQLTFIFHPENIIINLDFVKQRLLEAFLDPLFEKTIVQLVSTTIKYQGIHAWPELLPNILKTRSCASTFVLESICSSTMVSSLENAEKRDILVYCLETLHLGGKRNANLINIVWHLSDKVNVSVLTSLLEKLCAMGVYKDTFDLNFEICGLMIRMCELDLLVPIEDNLNGILKFLLMCAESPHSDLVDIAAECWEFCDFTLRDENRKLYDQFLKDVVSVLFEQMHRTSNGAKHPKHNLYDIYEKEIRRSCHVALEVICREHGEIVCEVLLPKILENLKSDDLVTRETSIYTFGILSVTNSKSIKTFFEDHLNFFLSQLSDTTDQLLRFTTIQTLERFFMLIIMDEKKMESLILRILALILNNSEQIRTVALHLFLSIVEMYAGHQPEDEPFAVSGNIDSKVIVANYDRILMTFRAYYRAHGQTGPFSEFCETVATIFDVVKLLDVAPVSDHVEPLYLSLIQSFPNLSEVDFSSILPTIGIFSVCYPKTFLQYSGGLIDDCMKLTTRLFRDPNSLETCIALVDFFSETINLLDRSRFDGNFMRETTFNALDSSDLNLCQSGFGLLGELVRKDPYLFDLERVFPHLARFIQDFETYSNNAIWAFGEIATCRYIDYFPLQGHAESFIPKLIEKLTIVSNPHLKSTISMTLGKLGVVYPKVISIHVPMFFDLWCSTILQPDQKSSQYEIDTLNRALAEFVRVSPDMIRKNIVKVCIILKKQVWSSRFNIDVMIQLWALRKTYPDLDYTFKHHHVDFQGVARLSHTKANMIYGNFNDVDINFTS